MSDLPDLSPATLYALVAHELAKPQAAIVEPYEPPKRVSTWAQLATILGHGLDAGSTIYALQQAGLEESNPLYGKHPSTAKVLGIKGGVAALQLLYQHTLGKKHPKVANIMGYTTGLGLTVVAVHNFRLANEAKKRNQE